MRKIAIVILSIFFVLAALAGVLQSSWGKAQTVSFLEGALRNSGVKVDIGEISGNLPHQVTLKRVKIEREGLEIEVGTLEVRLSLWRLLKKEIAFTEVKGDQISWERKTETLAPPRSGKGFPYTLNVEYFQFTNVSIPGYFNTDLSGTLRIGKKNKHAFFDITGRRPEFPGASARAMVSIRRDGRAIAHLSLNTPTLDALPLKSPVDGALALEVYAQGPLNHIFDGRFSGTFSPKEAPGPWDFSGRFIRNEDLSWSIANMSGRSDWLRFQGSAELDKAGRMRETALQIQSDLLEIGPFKGKLFAHIDLQEENGGVAAKATWRIPQLGVDHHAIRDFQGTAEGSYRQGILTGSTEMKGDYLTQKWTGKTDFSWEGKRNSLFLPNYQVEMESLKIHGNLEIMPDKICSGTTEFAGSQWRVVSDSLYGNGSGKVVWFPIEGNQGARLDAKMSDFYWESLHAETASVYLDLANPFGNVQGTVEVKAEKAGWRTLFLEELSFQTSSDSENWPFQLFAEGEWKHPLSLQLDGFWRFKSPDLLISLQNGSGSLFNHPISLDSPVSFEYSPTRFRIGDLSLHVADATLRAQVDRDGENTDAHLLVDKMPLDFLSLNPLDVSVGGVFNLNAAMKERGGRLTGKFQTAIQEMQVKSLGEAAPTTASGALSGTFDKDRLDLNGKLTVSQSPLLDFALSLPVHLEVWPFTGELLYDKKAKGHVALNGRVENFLDFFDLGTHRLEGMCRCNLSFYNTLSHPLLEGTFDFEDGSYQNYFTGTELRHIHAKGLAEKDILFLRSLTATDLSETGTLSANGQISLTPANLFPFRFDAEFSKFNSVTFDLINTQANGKITLVGNWEQATAKGSMLILESDIAIPNRIPRKLPDLHVVYKNATKPVALPQAVKKKPYPLYLDLNIDAPDAIFISGRGLNSEWKGNFHIGGTQTAMTSQGKIELVKGEFVFSGRKFKLTEGTLSFSGMENELPFLNLAGEMDVKDVVIVARIKGPLNNPQVTFQSTPPLAMGTIMSYLLFGQDLSEINSFQALQIANSLSSLAGEGPSVLEATRKSLGVDRLQIITVPSQEEEGGETIAVQVGKYVSEDVLVSFSQGAEDASTNISIEVEMKGGLSFVLESQQQQEQGKFTLRWTKTY